MNKFAYILLGAIPGAAGGAALMGFFSAKQYRQQLDDLSERNERIGKELDEVRQQLKDILEKQKDEDKPSLNEKESFDEEDPEERFPIGTRKMQPQVPANVYEITEEQFSFEHPNAKTRSFTYYARDGILAEFNGAIVDNPRLLIGLVDLDRDDADRVYVRDETNNIEYEIEIEHSVTYDETYKDEVF